MKLNRKKNRLVRETNICGWLFVLPFVIGFVFLFAQPMYQSFIYSRNVMKLGDEGLQSTEFIRWENYRYLLKEDPKFVKELYNQLTNMVVKVLVIMFFSLFLALILSEQFPGRLLFRTVLFLPVIFGAAEILELFKEQSGAMTELKESTNEFVVMSKDATGFVEQIISSFGPLEKVIRKFTIYAGQVFNLLWSCGIQIILFVIGLQTIPAYLYEVAEMEGATKWETFWKITFPLLTPSILLCLVYTLIDYFNQSTNSIVMMIEEAFANRIDYACAMAWLYSIMVFLLIMIINGLLSRKIISMD